jgi:hypothetical protein
MLLWYLIYFSLFLLSTSGCCIVQDSFLLRVVLSFLFSCDCLGIILLFKVSLRGDLREDERILLT